MVKFSSMLPVIAGLLSTVEGHTRVFSLWVNDVDQGDGRTSYIRSPPNNNPVKDVSSADIICNTANTAVRSSVSAQSGDKVTFEWYHDNRGDDIIDGSHKGPITVYIAPASSNGAGAVWTKLAESGLSGGVWAVETLISNGGKHSATLPSSLAPGSYLLRAEIIALHEADADFTVNSARGAQFYPSCSQVTVSGSGSVTPPGGFNFIGGYSPKDPGVLFNLYGSYNSYIIPGPAVWNGAGSGSPVATKITASTTAVSVTLPTTTTAAPTTTKASTTAVLATATSTITAPVLSPAPLAPGSAAKYFQCGGKLWTGATTCAPGSACIAQNEYYSQCL